MNTQRPEPGDYAPFYNSYVALVPELDIVSTLEAQVPIVRRVAEAVPAERESFAYAAGKWTVRQVFGHMCDAERVFGFRAFTFSRSVAQPQPGFDENVYVEQARYHDIALAELAEEFAAIRSLNLRVLKSLRGDRWNVRGVANNNPITIRGLAYVMAGHVRHHLAILHDRYALEKPA
ncbi:MAG TPA: DinB family protein [Vicinamibacterales bacterium]|jgi:hypothetical protein|nr:DinB family protein [Vicinamibacterales bacterium]